MKKVCAIFFVFFLSTAVFAYHSEGGSDTVSTTDPVLYQQTDTDVSSSDEGTATDMQEPSGLGISAGIQMIISENLKVYIIPLRYIIPLSSLAGTLKFEAGIPFVFRKVVDWNSIEHKKSGLGDISIKTTYDYGDEVYFRGIYGLILKLPTGDVNATSSAVSPLWGSYSFPVPLGTGSWDIAGFLTAIRKFRMFRFFANFGYRINGTYEDKTTGTKTKYGGVLTFLLGTEYKLNPFLFPFLKVRSVNIGESRTDFGAGYSGNWDDMSAIDLILGTRYRALSFLGVSFGIEIPVFTKYNENILVQQKRKLVLNIKGEFRF